MKRRDFITLLGGAAAAWPHAARAQQFANMRRIGLLTGLAEDNPEEQARLAGFRKGLESQGWSEGRNLRIDYRFAPGGGTDQLQTFSKELVGLRPEVILADGTPNAAALQHETRTIPIVFVNVSDPIGSGFIDSLARPGHNLTGFALIEGSVAGKWLSMLKEIAPSLARVALLAAIMQRFDSYAAHASAHA
jgi:putative tryptophan/tyrosine transport system substrate-binding protein